MVKDNFFSQPVGRAVLYLNSMLSDDEFESNAEHVSAIIDELVFVCNEIEPQ